MHDIDRRRYTEDELFELADQGKLPGFLSPATYGPNLFEETAWQPVSNVSIVRIHEGRPYAPDTTLSILTAIRRRETNPTHPDVVSTPTQRMGAGTAKTLIAERAKFLRSSPTSEFELTEINPQRPAVIASFEPNVTALYHNENLSALVHRLLDTKLDFGDLSYGERRVWEGIGKVSLSRVVAGFSGVNDPETGDPLYEPIVMFGSVLSTGALHLPLFAETDEYRNITFTNVGRFAHNVTSRSVTELVVASEWDEVYACVRGLCLATSVQATSDLQDLWRHMGFERTDPYRHSRDPSLGLNVITAF